MEAARRGARVSGLDLFEDRLGEARKRSLAAGVEVDWQQGDALRLPYPDDSLDIVIAITLLYLDPSAAICENGPGCALAGAWFLRCTPVEPCRWQTANSRMGR